MREGIFHFSIDFQLHHFLCYRHRHQQDHSCEKLEPKNDDTTTPKEKVEAIIGIYLHILFTNITFLPSSFCAPISSILSRLIILVGLKESSLLTLNQPHPIFLKLQCNIDCNSQLDFIYLILTGDRNFLLKTISLKINIFFYVTLF